MAPHTSNWDGILGMAALAGLDARISFFGKHTIFRYFGLGAFLKYMGGIPVNRANPGGAIGDAIRKIKNIEISLIGMAPEGTRSKVAEWKTGFLRIAEEINAKIIPVSLDFAKKLLNLNAYFSASGIITFKKSQDLQKTFKEIPTEKLLVETDSPFLAPDPLRGKKNEPSFIIHTLKKLATIKNIDTENLDKITTEYFNKLFF